MLSVLWRLLNFVELVKNVMCYREWLLLVLWRLLNFVELGKNVISDFDHVIFNWLHR